MTCVHCKTHTGVVETASEDKTPCREGHEGAHPSGGGDALSARPVATAFFSPPGPETRPEIPARASRLSPCIELLVHGHMQCLACHQGSG